MARQAQMLNVGSNPGAYVTDFSFIGDAGKTLGSMIDKYPELQAIDAKARANESFKKDAYKAVGQIYEHIQGDDLQKYADHTNQTPEEAHASLTNEFTQLAKYADTDTSDEFTARAGNFIGKFAQAGVGLDAIGEAINNGHASSADAKVSMQNRRDSKHVQELTGNENMTQAKADQLMLERGMGEEGRRQVNTHLGDIENKAVNKNIASSMQTVPINTSESPTTASTVLSHITGADWYDPNKESHVNAAKMAVDAWSRDNNTLLSLKKANASGTPSTVPFQAIKSLEQSLSKEESQLMIYQKDEEARDAAGLSKLDVSARIAANRAKQKEVKVGMENVAKYGVQAAGTISDLGDTGDKAYTKVVLDAVKESEVDPAWWRNDTPEKMASVTVKRLDKDGSSGFTATESGEVVDPEGNTVGYYKDKKFVEGSPNGSTETGASINDTSPSTGGGGRYNTATDTRAITVEPITLTKESAKTTEYEEGKTYILPDGRTVLFKGNQFIVQKGE